MNSAFNIICKEELNLNRLKYTIDYINNHPLKPTGVNFTLNDESSKGIYLSYSKKIVKGLFIPTQNLFFSNDYSAEKYHINHYTFDNQILYSVENVKKEPSQFIVDDSFGFDIFETIFFHISRFEEVHCEGSQLDKHKRMKSSEQLLFKTQIHQSPVVDSLIYYFFKSLDLDISQTKTTYSLSHDIDIISKYNSIFKSIKSVAKAMQMKLGLGGVLDVTKSIFKSFENRDLDPYHTYDWLFLEDDKFVYKIVYFVSGGKTRYDLYNKNYLKELPEIVSKANSKSYNIGFHPSYNAFDNLELFKAELKRLNKSKKSHIVNVRTHYLRLDIQKTFELFEGLGFEYDSTLGYADDIGFRCGTGFEYYPYNFKKERAWNFKEIPLVFMDSSLIYSICRDEVECFKKKAESFFEQNKFNTHIMMNFHNSTFDSSLKFRKGLKEVYLNLVKKF